MTVEEAMTHSTAPRTSDKRKARHESAAVRRAKQHKQTNCGNNSARVEYAVKSADHATHTALKHIFTFGDTDNSDPQLDKVLACAHDENLICSALRIAGTRMKQWTVDKNSEYGDEIRMQQITARFKKMWTMKLLPHLFKNLDERLEFSYKRMSAASETSCGYKIALNVTPSYSAKDFEENVPEIDGSEDEALDDDEYVPPSVVSGAFRRSVSHRASQRQPAVTAAPPDSECMTVNHPLAHVPSEMAPAPAVASASRLRSSEISKFPSVGSCESVLRLQIPRRLKIAKTLGSADIHNAVREAIRAFELLDQY